MATIDNKYLHQIDAAAVARVTTKLKLTAPTKLKLTAPVFVNALNSIKAAKIIGNWLCFESFEYVDGKTYEKILIRACYKELYEKLIESKLDTRKVRATIIGTPGIGKSIFLFYALFCLNSLGYTVLFQHSLLGPENFILSSPDATLCNAEVNTKNVVALCDTVMPNLPVQTILVTSLCRDAVFNEFKKTHGRIFHTMPIWSVDEVQEMIQNVPAYQPLAKEYMERYSYFKGVPETIFVFPLTPRLIANLEEEVKSMVEAFADVENVFTFTKLKSLEIPDDVHSLVHMIPNPELDRFTYRFASPKVAFIMAEKLRGDDNLANLGNAIQFLRTKGVGSLAGDLFEPYAFFYLENGGKIPIRKLTDGSVDTVNLEFQPQQKNWFSVANDFRGYDNSTLQIPEKSNFTAIFQHFLAIVTCNTRHEFKVDYEVAQLLDKLENDEDVIWSIAWIVPKNLFSSYKEQDVVLTPTPKFKTKAETPEREEEALRLTEQQEFKKNKFETAKNFQQYVISLDI